MKKNDWNRQYYLEPQDVYNNSEIESTDLADEWGDNYAQWLKHQASPRIYLYMFSALRVGNRKKHHDSIKYLIDTDETKQKYFRQAVIEYIRSAINIGSDIYDYTQDGKVSVPPTVMDILAEGGLWHTNEPQILYSDLKKWLDEA